MQQESQWVRCAAAHTQFLNPVALFKVCAENDSVTFHVDVKAEQPSA